MAVEWSPLALEIYYLIFPRGVGGIVVYGRSRRPRLNAFQETPSYVSIHACACFVLSIYIYIHTYNARCNTSKFIPRESGRKQEIEATMVRDVGDRGTNTYIRPVI